MCTLPVGIARDCRNLFPIVWAARRLKPKQDSTAAPSPADALLVLSTLEDSGEVFFFSFLHLCCGLGAAQRKHCIMCVHCWKTRTAHAHTSLRTTCACGIPSVSRCRLVFVYYACCRHHTIRTHKAVLYDKRERASSARSPEAVLLHELVALAVLVVLITPFTC